MGIESAKEGKLLYHLTKLENLDSILSTGLLSRKIVKNNNINFSDVADPSILEGRAEHGLETYVPFHFHPYSAFDVAVKNTYRYDEFIYICITRKWAKKNNFKILPMHPLSGQSNYELLEYDEGFKKIDWNTMHIKGSHTDYSKHVKMAECLTDKIILFKYFQCIAVRNDEVKRIVEKMIKAHGLSFNPPFIDKRNWF